jgi:RNA polymerase sigma-70 factor (TIGR02960 family)
MELQRGKQAAGRAMAKADLMSRALAGDGQAFQALTEPHRRELQVHCYRMLGSFQDAEDALQEAMLAAWRGLQGFDGRASLRTWLYRIATNRCVDALRAGRRRPPKQWDIPGIEPPEPTGYGEIHWLEPYPDALLDDAIGVSPGPEARYERAQSLSLAFVTALQGLPPRQLAVLILRDVLGFHADEVADMLDTTVESVKSALKRARAAMQEQRPATTGQERAHGAEPAGQAAIVARFVSAYEAADIDALVALFTDDVFLSMPPMPLEYRGRDSVAAFFAFVFGLAREFRLVPARANGQPAFGVYLRTPTGMQGVGFFVLTLAGERISAVIRFEEAVFPAFGLPPSLPGSA